LAYHQSLWVDCSEGVNDDLSLDGLDGINYDGNGARIKLLEALLSIYIDAGEPATKTRVRVI
jgi:hypothetical protein